jgi:hypothetical protein
MKLFSFLMELPFIVSHLERQFCRFGRIDGDRPTPRCHWHGIKPDFALIWADSFNLKVIGARKTAKALPGHAR